MSTFRSVVKPRKKIIATDVAGTLDFQDTYNSADFTSGQSANITTLVNILNWIDRQTIMFHNSGATDVIIDGSLMDDGLPIDIEQDTTALLFWIQSLGKFKDQGGTARIKDVEINFAAHVHNGVDSNRVTGTDVDSAASNIDTVLTADGAGNAVWKNFPGIVSSQCAYSNTDVLTDLNTTIGFTTEVPVLGTAIYTSPDFTVVGNGIRCNFNGKVHSTAPLYVASGSTKADVHTRFSSSRLGLFGPIGTSYIGTGAVNASPTITCCHDVLNGDIIYVMAKQGASTGVATLDSVGTSFFGIERIE